MITAATATRYSTSPVPSLTRLSPSTMVTSLPGTPNLRAIGLAASGSVGETIAPRTTRSPTGIVDECVRDDRDTDGRREHETDREQPDRPHVRPQLAKRGEESRAVEQRREHAEEDELWVEIDRGIRRNDSDRKTTEHEEDRIRDPKRRRDREHRRNGEDQAEGDQAVLELEVHRPSGSARSLDGGRLSARDRPGW